MLDTGYLNPILWTYMAVIFGSLLDLMLFLFYTLWRKCIRKLLYLSPITHSRFPPLLCDDIPVELQLFRRFNKFLWNVLKSSNPCVTN